MNLLPTRNSHVLHDCFSTRLIQPSADTYITDTVLNPHRTIVIKGMNIPSNF